MGEVNVLEARGISKSYPGVQALDAVDFELRAGEVHALVGQNGAGKSTFIEIVAGALQPDGGRLSVAGISVPHLDPSRSIELGIQTVHQENQLVEELSVAEATKAGEMAAVAFEVSIGNAHSSRRLVPNMQPWPPRCRGRATCTTPSRRLPPSKDRRSSRLPRHWRPRLQEERLKFLTIFPW